MKKAILLIIIVCAGAAALYSLDLESMGLTVAGSRTEDGFNVVTLEESSGFRFDVYYQGNIDEEDLNALATTRQILASWNIIQIQSVKVINQDDYTEITIIPSALEYGGYNFLPHLPAGMTFYYTGILEYDFRIIVQNMTLRVKGPYYNETQLAEQLKKAVENPVAYIQTNDPAYMVKQLAEVTTALVGLENFKAEAEAEIGDLKTVLAEMTESYETLAERHRALQLSAIAVAHQGIFSSIKDFNQSGIETAISIKEENPGMTEEELIEACKERDISLSKKEAQLVFSVIFQEYHLAE